MFQRLSTLLLSSRCYIVYLKEQLLLLDGLDMRVRPVCDQEMLFKSRRIITIKTGPMAPTTTPPIPRSRRPAMNIPTCYR